MADEDNNERTLPLGHFTVGRTPSPQPPQRGYTMHRVVQGEGVNPFNPANLTIHGNFSDAVNHDVPAEATLEREEMELRNVPSGGIFWFEGAPYLKPVIPPRFQPQMADNLALELRERRLTSFTHGTTMVALEIE